MRILLIDDEKKLVEALKQLFVENHFAVDLAHDGVEGLELARNDVYDVLIVDVMLPHLSGYELVEILRKEGSSVPILLLTAKDGVDDRVYGLDHGADDYLVKPFATSELLARVRALTRRKGNVVGTEKIGVGDLQLDLVTRQVTCGQTVMQLTAKEFLLLELFLRHEGQVLPKEVLLDRVWGYEALLDTNAVEIYVHFLRKKLLAAKANVATEKATLHIPMIETVRGVGYVLKAL
ncbi:response regulator transcription factor [Sulfoacidibacillus thermotolerans]|uniref:DNA-binding response regulator n=1 Tax=Sulfoacidibacillus thermotolerans TaxID=1765684 RepID=A0A2U3DC61_SULT2|nr:response regulator transcription factor [Sulfoacidibacillus thermotolerans]PWI58869.1 DNA-binding response regulator [Sulfoacidibacillus thermotolerans]